MERRCRITSGMRAAGDDFRIRFNNAHLDPLHAVALERVGYSPTASPGYRIEVSPRAAVAHPGRTLQPAPLP